MKALRERQAKGLAEPYKEVWMNERKWMNGWMNVSVRDSFTHKIQSCQCYSLEL